MTNRTPTRRRIRRSSGYPELTDAMIERFTETAKQISESIAKDQTREMVLDPKIINTLKYVERFVSKNRLIVYGGTALNAVLPPKDQFYSTEYDLPDWDFFSDDPVKHAITIADDVHKNTGSETFVTTAAHHGTYKVYADGVSIADITHVDSELLDVLRKHALTRDNILYSGPDYLRMAAYLELSRPRGQVERWEKVMKRLSLLNRAHPIQIRDHKPTRPELSKSVRTAVLRALVNLQDTRKKEDEEFAFIGPECVDLLRRSIGRDGRKRAPEFSIPRYAMYPMLISPNPKKTLRRITRTLGEEDGVLSDGTKIHTVTRQGRGEFLPDSYEVRIGKKGPIACFIIGTSNGCQSVYRIESRVPSSDGKRTQKVLIASIESCLYMFLSIRFAKVLPVSASAILKICDKLVHLHYKALLLDEKPILPLPTECVGDQETLNDMRKERRREITNLSKQRGWKTSAEYYLWNIRYNGGDDKLHNTIYRALETYKRENAGSDTKKTRTKQKTLRRKKTRNV